MRNPSSAGRRLQLDLERARNFGGWVAGAYRKAARRARSGGECEIAHIDWSRIREW